MISKKLKLRILLIVALAIAIVILFLFLNNTFFTMRGVNPHGDEMYRKLEKHVSPNGQYELTLYLSNGGATTDFGILGRIKDRKTKKEWNIYNQYHCYKTEVVWKDKDTVIINGAKIGNIKTDYYESADYNPDNYDDYYEN